MKAKIIDTNLILLHRIADIVVKIFGKETSKKSFLYEVMLMQSLPKRSHLIELTEYAEYHENAIVIKYFPLKPLRPVGEQDFYPSGRFKFKISIETIH